MREPVKKKRLLSIWIRILSRRTRAAFKTHRTERVRRLIRYGLGATE